MWSLILTAYTLVFLTLITATTLVAAFSANHRHGTRAHNVLRTLISATLGASGVLVLALRLYSGGLI